MSDDNVFSIFSYIDRNTKLLPTQLDQIAKILIKYKSKPNGKGQYIVHKDVELSKLLVNSIKKLGFAQLSYDYAISLEKENSEQMNTQIQVEYFISNFVYFTKAFHDSVALIINHIGKLGLKGGDIDLKKQIFNQKLVNSNLVNIKNEVSKNRSWINKVVNWRDELIHRSSNPILTKDDPTITKDFSLYVSKEPISIFGQKQSRKMNLEPISSFCSPWMENNVDLMESVCKDIIILYGNKTSVNIRKTIKPK